MLNPTSEGERVHLGYNLNPKNEKTIRPKEGLTLETSALKLCIVANLHRQLS